MQISTEPVARTPIACDIARLVTDSLKDISCFSKIYDIYYLPLYRFVLSRCHDMDTAGDITSLVFLKAMENLKTFRFIGVPFEAWLFRIARNEMFNLYRRNKLEMVYNLNAGSISNLAEETGDPVAEENTAVLLKALEKLHHDEMEMVLMRYYQKCSFRQVSDILGISEGNAKVKMHRIIRKLQKIIHQIPRES